MKQYAALILLLPALLMGCGQKEEDDHAGHAHNGSANEGVTWTVPADWVEETPSNSMRKAQFVLPKADGDAEDVTVVITHFPGEGAVGGIEANIQRWYTQMKQPDGGSTSDVATTSKSTVNGIQHTRVSMTGTYSGGAMMGGQGAAEKSGYKMVATIVETSGGPHFVKMVGPQATVAKWEASYDEFLKSFK